MRAIEFKSKLSKNRILIPKKIQSELVENDKQNVQVILLFDDSKEQEFQMYSIDEQTIDLAKDELDSINRGLKDFEEGKIHPHESARKIYGKYL